MIFLLMVHTARAFEATVSSSQDLQYAVTLAAASPEDDTIHIDQDLDNTVVAIANATGSITIDSASGMEICPLAIDNSEVYLSGLTFSQWAETFIPIEYRFRILGERPPLQLYLHHSTVMIHNSDFVGGDPYGIISLGTELTLVDVDVTSYGAFPFLVGINLSSVYTAGSLTVTNGNYTYNSSGVFQLWGDMDRPATFTGATFQGNSGSGGADIEAHNTHLEIYGSGFTGTRASRSLGAAGAPISTRVSDLKCSNCTFTDTYGEDAQAIAAHVEGEDLSVEGTTFQPASDNYVPFLRFEGTEGAGGTASMTDLHYEPGSTTSVPVLFDIQNLTWAELGYTTLNYMSLNLDSLAFHLNSTTSMVVDFNHVQICNAGNPGDVQGYPFISTSNVDLTIQRSVFTNIYIDNFLSGNIGDQFQVYNNTFWGVTGSEGMVTGTPDHLDFVNNIVANGESAVWTDQSVDSGTEGYNLWYQLQIPLSGPGSIFNPTTDLEDDPLLIGFNPSDCTDLPIPAAGSPVTDAGMPGTYDDDESQADIGAYPALEDTAIPDDTGDSGDTGDGGSDSGSLDDVDGDGFPDAVDCDDGDPEVNPAAAEVPNDGLDQDCDGADTLSELGGGVACGCSSSGGSRASLALGLLLLLKRRQKG